MTTRTARLALAALTALAFLSLAPSLGAQEQRQQMVQPEPLDANDPRAKQARAFAELVLAGDTAKAEAWLKANATPEYAAAAALRQDLTQLMGAVQRGLVIVRFDALGPNAVGVPVAKTSADEPAIAIMVRMEPTAPHRVTAVRLGRISMGG